ncbi:MAG: LysM peptidoglycan-binding domain-containing protein [Candidatus Theseobacter exili]|nr:LysM peptidoglycan-binding domain-containing protein [Candidatus Theseobacter exili]
MKYIGKIISILFLVSFVLVQGCTTVAMKSDVDRIEGTIGVQQAGLGEEIRSIKARIGRIESNLSELESQNRSNKKRTSRFEREIVGRLNSLDKQISRLQSLVARIKDEDLTLIVNHLNKLKKDTDKQIQIVLEEVTRENTKLSREISQLKKRSGRATRAVRTAVIVEEGEHVVRSGESLSSIAQQYGTTVSSIVDYNDLDNPDSIYVGQVLSIPEK